MSRIALLLTAFSALLFSTPVEREWLVIIYMAADNNLSPYSYRDLWEMEAVGSTDNMDVVVFHDGEKPDGIRYYRIEKSKSRKDYSRVLEEFIRSERLESQPKQTQEEEFWKKRGDQMLSSPVLRHLPEADSGAIETAAAFMHWVFAHFSAKRILLLGWSHGEGFDAQFFKTFVWNFDGRQGGFAFDNTSRNHMAVKEMAAGVKKLIHQYRNGAEIDIAGSDACLNQQVEFGYEWTGIAKYVFGSSSIVQKKGFNYKTLLDWFSKNATQPTDRLGAKIPDLFRTAVTRKHESYYSSYYDPSATMATWTISELEPLKISLEELGEKLVIWLKEPTDILEQVKRLEDIRKVLNKGIRFGNVSYDLHAFLLSLNVWAREHDQREVIQAINTVERALNRSVLSSFIGEKYQNGLLRSSKGVALWLPSTDIEFEMMYPKFVKSRFYQTKQTLSKWAEFVELFGASQ